MNFFNKYKYIMPCILGLTMVYGVVNFRGAPIRPCGEQSIAAKAEIASRRRNMKPTELGKLLLFWSP